MCTSGDNRKPSWVESPNSGRALRAQHVVHETAYRIGLREMERIRQTDSGADS